MDLNGKHHKLGSQGLRGAQQALSPDKAEPQKVTGVCFSFRVNRQQTGGGVPLTAQVLSTGLGATRCRTRCPRACPGHTHMPGHTGAGGLDNGR